MTENAQMANTTFSNKVRGMLGHDLDWWNSAMLLSLGAVAIAAVAVVLTTYAVLKLQKQAEVELTLQISKANERAAEANLKAETERVERLKLEAKIAPRFLSLEQKKTLIAALTPFSGQRVEVTSNIGDDEANGFANDFRTVFKDGKWVVEGEDLYHWEVNPVGIRIIVSAADALTGKIPTAAKALSKVLSDLGLSIEGSNSNDVSTGRILFVVGTKP